MCCPPPGLTTFHPDRLILQLQRDDKINGLKLRVNFKGITHNVEAICPYYLQYIHKIKAEYSSIKTNLNKWHFKAKEKTNGIYCVK